MNELKELKAKLTYKEIDEIIEKLEITDEELDNALAKMGIDLDDILGRHFENNCDNGIILTNAECITALKGIKKEINERIKSSNLNIYLLEPILKRVSKEYDEKLHN